MDGEVLISLLEIAADDKITPDDETTTELAEDDGCVF